MYTKKMVPDQRMVEKSASSVLDFSSQSESLQRKADLTNNAAQREEALRPNNTGLPDNLKSGIENLSGFSMDDVRVHYNSSKPATVQALAYTQGTDIHVAPGQEKHLPHEAWHVAQQMAGRVSPTTNINGMPVNDNATLEHEADVMGEKAVQCKVNANRCLTYANNCSNAETKQCTKNDLIDKLNELGKFTPPLTYADTKCTYQVPDGKAPYQVWRALVNAYNFRWGGATAETDDKEFLVTLKYKIEGNECESVFSFSKEALGYLISHYANGILSVINSRKDFFKSSMFHSVFNDSHYVEKGKLWSNIASQDKGTKGYGGDFASKLIAERGRFRCLEKINDDGQIVECGGYYFSPEEVWKNSDSGMLKYRSFVSFLKLETRNKVDVLSKFGRNLHVCDEKKTHWDTSSPISKAAEDRLNVLLTNDPDFLEKLHVNFTYPYENEEIKDARDYFGNIFFKIPEGRNPVDKDDLKK